jgi:hypothetical protein
MYTNASENLCLLVAIVVTVFIYFLLSLSLGVLSAEDILMLPRGNKILKMLYQFKLIKN